MSGLAMLLAEMGAIVSGSDAHDAPILEELRARRVRTFVGHDGAHVADAEIVLWSPPSARTTSNWSRPAKRGPT
jgi:UDP-N-acetylmuramate--alanine ligase